MTTEEKEPRSLQVRLFPLWDEGKAWIAHFQWGRPGVKEMGDYHSHTFAITQKEAIIFSLGLRARSLRKGSKEVYFRGEIALSASGPPRHHFGKTLVPIDNEALIAAIRDHTYPTEKHETLTSEVGHLAFSQTPIADLPGSGHTIVH